MTLRLSALAGLVLILAGTLSACGDDPAKESESASSAEHSGDHSEPAEASESAAGEASDPGPAEEAANLVEITIADGTVTPKPGVIAVPLDEDVTIAITSDIEDEIHVHGYDKEFELKPGGTASVTFKADIPGVFEIETHESGELLAELKVE
jgi:hypothetical protein